MKNKLIAAYKVGYGCGYEDGLENAKSILERALDEFTFANTFEQIANENFKCVECENFREPDRCRFSDINGVFSYVGHNDGKACRLFQFKEEK